MIVYLNRFLLVSWCLQPMDATSAGFTHWITKISRFTKMYRYCWFFVETQIKAQSNLGSRLRRIYSCLYHRSRQTSGTGLSVIVSRGTTKSVSVIPEQAAVHHSKYLSVVGVCEQPATRWSCPLAESPAAASVVKVGRKEERKGVDSTEKRTVAQLSV